MKKKKQQTNEHKNLYIYTHVVIGRLDYIDTKKNV